MSQPKLVQTPAELFFDWEPVIGPMVAAVENTMVAIQQIISLLPQVGAAQQPLMNAMSQLAQAKGALRDIRDAARQ